MKKIYLLFLLSCFYFQAITQNTETKIEYELEGTRVVRFEKNNVIEEFTYDDNGFMTNYKRIVKLPDFKVSINAMPAVAENNSWIDIELLAENIGDLDMEAIDVSLFLSTDNLYDTDDLLFETKVISRINAGESVVLNISTELPLVNDIGDYYIIVFIDPNKLIPEYIEDNNTASQMITIHNCDLVIDELIKTNDDCGVSEGEIELIITGGTEPITYTWTDENENSIGDNSNILQGLSRGDYNITIIDANDCAIEEKSINIDGADLMTLDITTEPANCNNKGSAEIIPNNGVYPFIYHVEGFNQQNSSQFLNMFSANNYTITVTDDRGCKVSDDFTVSGGSPITINLKNIDKTICGQNNGSILIEATGGNGSYSYQWSNGAVGAIGINNLSKGEYTVTVSDGSCIAYETFDVQGTEAIKITPLITEIDCNGNDKATIELSVTGGNGNYTYEWLPAVSSNHVAQNLNPGTYEVTVKDDDNCSDIDIFVINNLKNISTNINKTSTTCGENNGEIDVKILDGYPPYSIELSLNTASIQIVTDLTDNHLFQNLNAGNYEVLITDSKSCTKSSSFTVEASMALKIESQIINHDENSQNIGTVDIEMTGGSGNYDYLWSNGSSNADLTNLSAGTYTLTVTDNIQNCKLVQDFIIYDRKFCEKICVGGALTPEYQFSVSNGNSYLWVVENGSIQSGQNSNLISVKFNPAISDAKVKVTVTDNDGKVETIDFPVEIVKDCVVPGLITSQIEPIDSYNTQMLALFAAKTSHNNYTTNIDPGFAFPLREICNNRNPYEFFEQAPEKNADFSFKIASGDAININHANPDNIEGITVASTPGYTINDVPQTDADVVFRNKAETTPEAKKSANLKNNALNFTLYFDEIKNNEFTVFATIDSVNAVSLIAEIDANLSSEDVDVDFSNSELLKDEMLQGALYYTENDGNTTKIYVSMGRLDIKGKFSGELCKIRVKPTINFSKDTIKVKIEKALVVYQTDIKSVSETMKFEIIQLDNLVDTDIVLDIDIYKLLKKNIVLYPNPVNDIFSIETTGLTLNEISISNILGQTVYKQSDINSQFFEINMTNQNAGYFHVKVNVEYQNNNYFIIKKIIKK